MSKSRIRFAPLLACLSLVPLLTHCGDSVVDALSSSDGGSTGKTSSSGNGDGSPQNGAACAAPTSLVGTWDLLGASPGSPSESGTLTMQTNFFSIAINGTSLVFSGAGAPVNWIDPQNGAISIATAQTSAPMNLGLVPLNLGGAWTFSEDGSACQAMLGAAAFSGTCGGVDGLPWPLPYSLDGTAGAQRQSAGTSIFGDVGGTWHLALQGGSCDATLSANTVSITCAGDRDVVGSVQATFCAGSVSGQTNDGTTFTGVLQ